MELENYTSSRIDSVYPTPFDIYYKVSKLQPQDKIYSILMTIKNLQHKSMFRGDKY